MRASLIVAAGGSGSRFQRSLSRAKAFPSKLFFPLDGRPLLARSVEAFQEIPQITETILAVPQNTEREVRALIRQEGWQKVQLVRGGGTRAESVWRALQKTNPKNQWIAVHDGARPFVSKPLLKKFFESVTDQDADGLIFAQKVVPTIKEADQSGVIRKTLDRRALFEAQTPQLVRRNLLEQAYRRVPKAFGATDEASLLEAIGAAIRVFVHEDWNPKITTYKDFELAEAHLEQKSKALFQSLPLVSEGGGKVGERLCHPTLTLPVKKTRGGEQCLKIIITTGLGRDTHRLVPGRPFILGGVRIPFEKGPLGHSDGDVLLHAVIDGILGAAGEGDIGEWFSDRDPKNKGISSKRMLQAVLQQIGSKNWRVQHVDSTVFLENPKLTPYKEKIRKSIAETLGISSASVSVKAKTMEGLGPIGEGLAVSAEALVTMRRSS